MYFCNPNKRIMNIKITAIRKADYRDCNDGFRPVSFYIELAVSSCNEKPHILKQLP